MRRNGYITCAAIATAVPLSCVMGCPSAELSGGGTARLVRGDLGPHPAVRSVIIAV